MATVAGWLCCWLCCWLCPVTSAWADKELDYGLEEHRLAKINLSGNTTFSDNDLKGILRIHEPSLRHPLAVPHYGLHIIDSQLRTIERYYQRRGFHQATATLDSIVTIPDEGDALYISLVEGPRTWITAVVLEGTEPLDESEVREQLRLVEGQPAPADLNDLGGEIYAMRSLYWDHAYLDVTIEASLSFDATDDPDQWDAAIHYQVRPGPAYTIRNIAIQGNRLTRIQLIERELLVEEGGPLAWSAVEQSRRRLLETALFRDVAFVPTARDSANGLADLDIKVIERKPAFFEVGAGIGSRDRIRVTGTWAHNNLWGTGRRFSVRGRLFWNVEPIIDRQRAFAEGDLNYRAEILYTNPHAFSSDFSLNLYTFVKRETRGESALILDTRSIAVGTRRAFGPRWDNQLRFQILNSLPEVHPLAPENVKERFDAADITDTQTNSLIFSTLHDHRNDPFLPVYGYLASTEFQLAGGLMRGNNSFFKWSGSGSSYLNFLGGVVAFRLRLGFATPYGDSKDKGADGVPYDSRFFAGGSTTVRGYRYNSLGPQVRTQDELDDIQFRGIPLADDPARGGNYLMLANVEWRFPFPLLSRWNFSGVLFFDSGNVWASTSDILLKGFRLRSYPGDPRDEDSTKLWDYRYSWGPGIRLKTPFGPFRFDVGIPLKRARYVSLDKEYTDPKVIYTFALGYPF